MAKVIMVQGTMSNVGKSFVVAGLLRVMKQDGFKVAPFKSQNMALNSFVTDEGLEMGRAQVMQAEAAKIKPSVKMNPILLKPTTDMGSQVVVNGKPIGNMKASEYFKYKHNLVPQIMESFNALKEEYDIIVIEGAGSPAEINLKQEDIVNMGMAKMADCPVILVGDIDRGGIFAQLYGTVELLEEDEQDRIFSVLINKFRGDRAILEPGIKILEDKLNKPVIGVLPMIDIEIDDEDSLSSDLEKTEIGLIDIVVIRLPKISNFTDFNSLEIMPNVSVRYVQKVKDLKNPDLIIIPGTKNTIEDMKWLRESGLENSIIKKSEEGTLIFGVCGGYQILGETIKDEHMVEGKGEIKGVGLLPVSTIFAEGKITTQVEGEVLDIKGEYSFLSNSKFKGYEIHMGVSENFGNEFTNLGGCYKNNVAGSYVHGIFDSMEMANKLVKGICDRKGIEFEEAVIDFEKFKETQYDILAQSVRDNIDMDRIYNVLGVKK